MGPRTDRTTRLATRWAVAAALTLTLGALCLLASQVSAGPFQDGKADPPKKDEPAKPAAPKLGLIANEAKAFQGYTLLAPMQSKTAYLMDMQGRVVNKWETNCTPGVSTYLLESGHLLRPGSLGGEEMSFGGGPGAGGRVQEYTWDGELVWDFKLFNDKQLPHHDIRRLPNGNVLMVVWDKKMSKEAAAAGRRPEMLGEGHLLPDSLVEVKPTGKTTGEVVWEWHLWDHLVQDYDKTKANYGNVAEHPELVNINYGEDALAPITASKDGQDKLKSLGYVGANKPGRHNPDWTHFNGVDYNPDLDQIIVSVHNFSEFWIIDHSTTKSEAAGHSGGKSGKGGDLLYRWGNPLAYRAGKKADQKLFAQHNAHWIPKGLPGAGHLLVFNNGGNRPDGSYSSVDELILPVDEKGHYEYKPGAAYGPNEAVWSYSAPKKTDFYSFFISGAQRQPNGNTLICSGANGTVFEVTPEKEVVWKYVNPVKGAGPGPGGIMMVSQPGQLIPGFLRDGLQLSAEQKKQVDELQKEVDGKLEKLLTEDQRKQLKERPQGPGPGGFGGPPQPGQVLSKGEQDRLKLSAEQKKDLAEFQKDVDGKLDKILKDDQKKRLADARNVVMPLGGPPGRGGPPGAGGPPPQPGQVLPAFVRDQLKLTDDQKKELDDFQKEADAKLEKLLTDEQKKTFKEPQGGFGAAPQPGQLMSPTLQARLKLTADQKKEVEELQKATDAKLEKLLTDDQKKQVKEARQGFGRGGPGGGGFGGPGGRGGPGGMPNFGPGGGSAVFRAYRYAANYPGLAGKDLMPGKTVEELEKAKEQPKKP
jgi:Spy/CpxP family protein refolding chaperone